MNRFQILELLEPSPSSITLSQTTSTIFPTFLHQDLHHLPHCSPFHLFDSLTDLIPFQPQSRTDLYLKTLSDRVSSLELTFDRFLTTTKPSPPPQDRKYTWTAEINSPTPNGLDRKYKYTADIKGNKNEHLEQKTCKWTAEYKGKGSNAPLNTYTFKASTSPVKKTKNKLPPQPSTDATPKRQIQITEPDNAQAALYLKQAFDKRAGAVKNGKGKKKQVSPQDAALLIQRNFRAYLIRRSQALRALRELAIAKSKLKELRVLFNNFSYRRRVARDAEERQKFSERIIVLLLTVDAIEGADLMVRAARRSMVDELEAMLDAIDPQPAGKLGSMKRRTFDMPDGGIQREIASGVAEVVHMLDQEEKAGANTFEVCL